MDVKDMKKFNDEIQNLVILEEECAEVIQVASKCIRFGADSFSPLDKNKTKNWELLENELGDIIAMIDILNANGYVAWKNIIEAAGRKHEKLEKFYSFKKKGKRK